jgi:hypothetical protein
LPAIEQLRADFVISGMITSVAQNNPRRRKSLIMLNYLLAHIFAISFHLMCLRDRIDLEFRLDTLRYSATSTVQRPGNGLARSPSDFEPFDSAQGKLRRKSYRGEPENG